MQPSAEVHNIRRAGKNFAWPGGAPCAVVFDIAFQGWSDGHAPAAGDTASAHYGVVRGIERLLRIAARHRIATSIWTSGVLAERWPDLVRDMRRGGHEIVAHSYAMDVRPAALDEAAERANIQSATALIEYAAGVRPTGWISPDGAASPRSLRLLADAGYLWHGDSRDDDLPALVEARGLGGPVLTSLPLTVALNDLNHCIRHGRPPAELLDQFKLILDRAPKSDAQPFHLDVIAHAHVLGRPGCAWVLDAMMAHARERSDIWITTRGEMSAYARANEAHFVRRRGGFTES